MRKPYEYGKNEPYYPIKSDENLALYQKYLALAKEKYPNIHLLGRFGDYITTTWIKPLKEHLHLWQQSITNKILRDKHMNTAIIFAANNAYAPGVIINIAQIEHLHSDFADKYLVYVDNWSQENLEKLNSICQDKIQVINYSEKDFWNKHPELAGIDKVSNFVKQYSHFKLAFADYVLHLDTYKQVIFFDCDLIVLNDISHIKTLKSGISFRYGFYESYKEQRIPGPNGGLISFASDLPFKKISKIFSDYVIGANSANADERAIARICFDLGLKINELDVSYNFCPTLRGGAEYLDSKDIKILHTDGPNKIWNSSFYQTIIPSYTNWLNKYKLPFNSSTDSPWKNFKTFSMYENSKKFICAQLNFLDRIPLLHMLKEIPSVQIDVETIFEHYTYLSHNSKIIRFNFSYINYGKFRVRCIYNSNETIHDFIAKQLCTIQLKNIELKFYKDSNRNIEYYYFDCDVSKLAESFKNMVVVFTDIINKYQSTFASALWSNSLHSKLVQHNISLSFSSTIRKIDTPNPISLTDLKDGDVLLCVADPNDCVSWVITYFTNAEVSHAALTYDAKNNVLVDAAGNHVRTALITDYLNDGRPIHVMRYQYNQNLKPVLASAKNFLDKQEPYANSTLVMLAAVLLLTKNIPQTSLAKKALTKLIKLVCGELMKLINKKVYPNSEPFVCSQFVAENFNRAQDYEPFIKYPLFFNDENNITKLYGQSQRVKLYNYLYDYGIDVNQTIKFGAQEQQQLTTALGDSLDTICSIIHQIIIFFDNERALLASNAATQELHRNMNAELLPADEIKKIDIELKSSISNLAASFYALHQTPENLAKLSAIQGKDLLEYLKTLENYFVTPGDLLFNCPALRYIGTLSAIAKQSK